MNEMNERRSSAEIVAEWRAELEIHDREAQDGDRTWHFTHYIRADPEMFIRAALRELDRLTAERDGAYTEYRSQLVAFRDEANERQRLLAEERDAARAENTRLRAHITRIAEACEIQAAGDGSRGKASDVGWELAMEHVGKHIRAALGIESEASE